MSRHSTAATVARLTGLASALALTACATQSVEGGRAQAPDAPIHASVSSGDLPATGGVIRSGASFATMARQYAPRLGPIAATGASAWVESAPTPAFVAEGPPPPAAPPAPPPAAVANRQPAANNAPARPAVPASDAVRPEAAAPNDTTIAPDPAVRSEGLALFNTFSCGACHVLADAGAGGSIGPSLDGNPRLTRAFSIDVISNGRGAMPSFAGQLTDEEIATLSDYIVQFSRK